ncbi:MAG: hypothetical protein ABNH15_08590 [Alcanivorax sp.]|jgi:hypothetical protein|nr:MAG: hypothetical protein COA68_03915 [Oceanobacter sp.]
MPEHSIELLGQKFSYPTTWQGSFSVLVVCGCITVATVMLSPEQIDSLGAAFGRESSERLESELFSINEKLSSENATLKNDLLKLTDTANIPEREKRKIVSQVETSEKELTAAYANVIEMQSERKTMLSEAIPASSLEQKKLLSIEEAKVAKQINLLKQQQEIQKIRY